MRMKSVSILPALLLSVVAIVLAVTGLYLSAQESRKAPVVAGEVPESRSESPSDPGYSYLFARNDIPPGTELTPELFVELESPVPFPGALVMEDVPFGEALASGLQAGRPLAEEYMTRITALQQVMKKGVRAMAFDLDSLTSVGGLLEPGDQVDMIAVFKGDSRNAAASIPVLNGVEVLAVKGATDPAPGASEDDRRRNTTMVLAIPEAEVGRVSLIASEAKLRFVAAVPDPLAGFPVEAAVASPQKDQAARPVFLADVRPHFPQARSEDDSPVRSHPKKGQTESGRKVLVFEGSEARTVYVR